MKTYSIEIDWKGPLTVEKAIKGLTDGGKHPNWDGKDYGLYQVYGRHIIYGRNALLYIGMTTDQTFSQRIGDHGKQWLDEDQDKKDVKIYVGRVYDPKKHSKKYGWRSWKRDIRRAERILIWKYSPNYNSRELSNEPKWPFKICSLHKGAPGKLESEDNVPEDFRKW